ncbi:MAG: hypothetical protein QOH31_1839, partial [Verrucomicrobiota bacterium]
MNGAEKAPELAWVAHPVTGPTNIGEKKNFIWKPGIH